MHWFWRSILAVLAAWLGGFGLWAAIWTLIYAFSNTSHWNVNHATANAIFLLMFPLTGLLALLAFSFSTRLFGPKITTRCRKCGRVLRNLKKPQCPHCGERI
jgi:hypothetical protein